MLLTVERVALLRRLEFFGGAPGHVLAAVAAAAEESTVGPGEVLMRQGEEGDALFVVVDGTIRVEINGRHVDDHGPGTVVGELAVLAVAPRSATVTAVGACRVLRLRKAVFDELLLDHPEVAVGVIAALVRRFRERDLGPAEAAGP